MAKLRLDLAYDGTDLRGWAKQPGHRTVEGELLSVLEPMLGVTPRVSVAGRTDAGVHASGQVASFEADAEPEAIRSVLNGRLAPEVVVSRARVVPDGFDARFSASWREYVYSIRTGEPDPFTARFSWQRPGELGLGDMRAAARVLLGEHDFASFGRATSPDGTTVRRIHRLSVARSGNEIRITIRANAFLRQMVRSLVGTLVEVGQGRIRAGALPEIISAGDRSAAGRVAPPQGLCLVHVAYAADRAGTLDTRQ